MTLLVVAVICGGWHNIQEDAAPPPPERPLAVGGSVTGPQKISGPNPGYTPTARGQRVQGVVILEAIIDSHGSVLDVRVLKSLEPSLDREAMEAVRAWKFKPATLDGVPVDVYYNLTVSFRLQESPGSSGARTKAAWLSRLEKVQERLRDRDWQAASKLAEKLATDMTDQIPNSSGNQVVATVLTYYALAQAELGFEPDAIWHWQIAQNVDLQAARMAAMRALPSTRAILDANRLRQPGTTADRVAVAGQADGITPPRPLEQSFPKPRRDLKRAWAEDPLEVELVVDASGWVHAPVVLKGELAGKIYLSLTAMRQWRFEPATLDGVPVPTLHRVVVTD